MNQLIDTISQPWHWAISGIAIALVMFLMIFFGKKFGFSSNLSTICAMCGAGKNVAFFNYDWKAQSWNLAFLVGSILGGFIAQQYLSTGEPVNLSVATLIDLHKLNLDAPTGLQPEELFGKEAFFTLKGFLLLAIGGLLIGFGTRYADGCTSGHAISGLSNLQMPSLWAVIGFFIGGIVMTFMILPFIV
ncbi:MAG: YeeE/YedE family protein [Pseudarcicella sp.]|nr:YeeE/YedE family protein [Pseudarcicella sp.]MBP6411071.1 YeeE/YedE family protein [Pseudarcicella sp.]